MLMPLEVHSPGQVVDIVDFKRVQAGIYHACGVRLDDSVYCWGDNLHGQLGNGTQTHSPVPVPAGPF
jgi:alpha-tubulin suppressor-like RCC1 family protein